MRGVGDGVPQRGVPGVTAAAGLRLGPVLLLYDGPGRQLHLIGDVTGFDEPEPLAGLRCDVLDVVELVIFIESLRGEEVDVDSIEPEALLNVDSLFETFFKAFGR